jgi:hypothetical protein
MSSKNNVNPDHYKVAGRERPGDAALQDVQSQQFAEIEARRKRGADRPKGERGRARGGAAPGKGRAAGERVLDEAPSRRKE